MLSPKALEAWFTLMAEATRGTSEAQEALNSLSDLSDPEEFNRWMSKFMPTSAKTARPEDMEAWLEDWWQMMGVVPRSRYLELLEKYDNAQRRLERAEETIAELQARLSGKDQQEEKAKEMMDMWGSMMAETLKTQTDLMQKWTAKSEEPAESAEASSDETEADSPAKDSSSSPAD